MKKKDYQKMTMKVVQLQHRTHLLQASSYETTGTGGTSLTKMEDDVDL